MEINTNGGEMYTDGESVIHVERDSNGKITAWGVEVEGMTDMRTDMLDEIEQRIAEGLRNGTLAVYR